MARAWTRAFDRIAEPELRLSTALSPARTLLGAERAIAFDDETVLAGVPGGPASAASHRLFARARRVLEDELISSELYVGRIAAARPERVAIRWRSCADDHVEVARTIVASCGWALERRLTERVPANLPDGGATLRRLEQLVHDARRMKRPFAVVYLDVEAEAALEAPPARDAVARRLRRAVRANDHLGHLGGDAYLALVGLEASEAEAYPAAQRLLRVAAAVAADATASVGVAVCPHDGLAPADLVEKAGAAAMAAATAGGTRPCWYRESAGEALAARAAVAARLRDGDPAALFELRLRPLFDATTGVPYAVTALAAWRDPGRDATPPAAYLAEGPDRAAVAALERWVIAAAGAAHRTWRALGIDLRVHLPLAEPTEAVFDALGSAFGTDDAMRDVLAEIAVRPASERDVESFARRLHAIGARVGMPASRTPWMPFDRTDPPLDFVTVDGTDDLRSLAGLAAGSVVAPLVIATGVDGAERGRWLARHGAGVLGGEGLAAPMPLHDLVRWASERRGSPVP